MLRASRVLPIQRASIRVSALSTAARTVTREPNAPLDLDPSLQTLLKDVDISISRHRAREAERLKPRNHRELEMYPGENSIVDPESLEDEDGVLVNGKDPRKSPAALFGSSRIGAVVIPLELQNSITNLIEGSDKHLLRLDAKRLFSHEEEGERSTTWESSYDTKYRSLKQLVRHEDRDGTAFASVVLPAHYSAIYAVLDHVTQRLGPEWTINRVIDWYAGTGSAMWASLSAFQKAKPDREHGPDPAQSTLQSYLGIDKREGLKTIGKRIVEGVDLPELKISWQKTFHEENIVDHKDGMNTLAISAFSLSSLPNAQARKQLVKEIWDSGADVMVLIDHSTLAGFESVAEARDLLLRLGRKEVHGTEETGTTIDSAIGSHVVAPCPHDGACPLHHTGSNRLVCGFSQRLQRPPFVRKTKHSGVGHEDIGYSYVVIRRGPRPQPVSPSAPKVGRQGQVGLREARKAEQRAAAAEQGIHELEEYTGTGTDVSARKVSSNSEGGSSTALVTDKDDVADVEDTLRLEAYSWPRLVFPPLKRSGHVIIDACHPQEKIMRMTIPKSQGKQDYYDARKSEWGDIFPHGSKNKMQERSIPNKKNKDIPLTSGGDIGKRGVDAKRNDRRTNYNKVAADLKLNKKRTAEDRARSTRKNRTKESHALEDVD